MTWQENCLKLYTAPAFPTISRLCDVFGSSSRSNHQNIQPFTSLALAGWGFVCFGSPLTLVFYTRHQTLELTWIIKFVDVLALQLVGNFVRSSAPWYLTNGQIYSYLNCFLPGSISRPRKNSDIPIISTRIGHQVILTRIPDAISILEIPQTSIQFSILIKHRQQGEIFLKLIKIQFQILSKSKSKN